MKQGENVRERRVVVFPAREVTFTFTHPTLGDARVGSTFEDAFESYNEAARADDVMRYSRDASTRPHFDWQDYTAPNGVRITASAADVVLDEDTPLADAAAIAEREAFEAHWCRDVPSMYSASAIAEIKANREGDRYRRYEVQWAWEAWQARAALATTEATDAIAPTEGAKLAVWYGPMPESNGKTNWTAILHKGDVSEGITIDRSEYPDRVRYEADRMRWMIGELADEPWILDYDADKHSGYATPSPEAPAVDALTTAPEGWKLVPVEPTREMLEAAYGPHIDGFGLAYGVKNWQDMLAASPRANAAPALTDEERAAPAVDAPMTDAARFFWQQHTLSDTSAMSMAELHNDAECVIRGHRTAPVDAPFKPVGRCECAFSQDECATCEANREAYQEHLAERAAPANAAHVMRRIRRCENETAAQVVLEHFGNEQRRTALSEAARLVELNGYDGAAFDIRALAASDSDGSKS